MVAQHVKELLEAGFSIFHGAPAAIVLLAPGGGDLMATVDTALAAQTLMLAAHGKGLANRPVALANAYLNLPSTRAELGLPDDTEVMLTVLIGTADGPWPEMPARHEPTVHWC
jgi:nitroreductase